MIAPARLAAYSVLRAVNSRRADLPAALVHARASLDDERDRALAGEIASGTLRWQAAFDSIITAYAKRPLDRLDPEIVDILRMTLFQLRHLDRVPASAAVNDAVDLARKAGKRSAAPLVNAVARRASRERDHLPLPPRTPGDPEAEVAYLATTLSHPAWLVRRWRDRYGFEAAEAWCRFNNEPPSLTLRTNTLRLTRQALSERLLASGVATRPARYAPDGLIVERGNPLLTKLAGEGLFHVQDEASQLVAVVVAAAEGERILDVCAAPGGKTLGMAAGVGPRGLVVAADVRRRRVGLLARTIRAAGASAVRVIQANASLPLPFREEFDCVLIDAPCSGLGTLRRDPDIKWRRAEADLETLADLQLRILDASAAVLRRGGRLVYSTCSSEPEENEQVIARFLDRSPEFSAGALRLDCAPDLINEAAHLRTLPFRDGLEGFFGASVVKAGSLR